MRDLFINPDDGRLRSGWRILIIPTIGLAILAMKWWGGRR